MEKVKQINGYVRTSLNKLSRTRFDLEIMNGGEKIGNFMNYLKPQENE